MFNLFNTRPWFTGAPKDKPRGADDSEITAYMHWQRERRGLPELSAMELHFAYSGAYRHRERGHCIGATFGDYHMEGHRREYENGAYSILMPGHDVHRHSVTLETLDEAGEIVASQTLPVEPKKGGVIWSREDVRKAAGPVAKVAKAKRSKVAPIPVEAGPIPVHANAMPEICQQEAAGSDVEPVAAYDSPEALDTLSGQEIASPELASEAYTLPAQPDVDTQGDAMAARIEDLAKQLASARLVPTYFDAETGIEKFDHAGRAFNHARDAMDRADKLQARLAEMEAAQARMAAEIDRLGDAMVQATARALRAEAALAAVQARKDGWPPAVRPATVNVRYQGPIAA